MNLEKYVFESKIVFFYLILKTSQIKINDSLRSLVKENGSLAIEICVFPE